MADYLGFIKLLKQLYGYPSTQLFDLSLPPIIYPPIFLCSNLFTVYQSINVII